MDIQIGLTKTSGKPFYEAIQGYFEKTYIKSVAMLLTRKHSNVPLSGLSNEILSILASQEAAKVKTVIEG